jgi:threonine/homoserine/homoserine lactone efflux protein
MSALLLAGYGVGFLLAAPHDGRCGGADRPALRDAGCRRGRRLLSAGSIRLAFGLLSAAVLIVIGARTLWIGVRARAGLESAREVAIPRRAFATTIAATALNPLTLALWTISFPAAIPSAADASTTRTAVVLVGATLGTLTWYGGFATAIALTRKRLGTRLVHFVDLATGCGLIGFGGLLGYRSVRDS